VRLLTSGEGRAVLVVYADAERAAFLAFAVICSVPSDSGRSLADADGKVARITLEAPALLLMILEAEVALEALDAEVDHRVLALVLQADP